MSLTQYVNEQNVDLINIFEPKSAVLTNISSGQSGLQLSVIAGNTGPFNFQTNGTSTGSQNINISTSTGNIYISPNKISAISLQPTGISFSPNGTTTYLSTDLSYVTCFNQWYYGVRVINNTTNVTHTILITDPRNIFFTGTSSCSLIFPPTPPNGTEYFIRKTSTTQHTITVTTNQTLRSNNTEQTTFVTTTYNSGVVYSSSVSKWICFNIGV